ncbi:MAG: protein kinase [Gemmatimonadota bacterium]|nr:protein kinase [Gemmatimonadota bacterium]
MGHDELEIALESRYTLEDELGRGGMATVYRARDLKHRRSVAIKVMTPQPGSELGAERFLQEIELSARLNHPHIVPLYDSGTAAGALYYVMPLVEGESLRERLKRDHQLPLDEALRLACEIADALAFAHTKGVVHRDVKPENVLLQAGHALLADFGIARAVHLARNVRLTREGLAPGTVAYMSPEQAAGDSDADERSDVYSLGCVLYEMLVGQLPFIGYTAQSVLGQRLTQEPPRPSLKRGGLGRGVDDLVQKAMARHPTDRFASARELADALSAAVSMGARTVTGAVAPAMRSIAVLPFESLSADPEDEFFADGISEEILIVLAQLEGLRVAARTSSFSFKGKREDMATVGHRLDVETVVEGTVRRASNRLRITARLVNVSDGFPLWGDRYDRERTDIFAIQDEIAKSIAGHLRVTFGPTADSLVKPPTNNFEAYELYLKARVLAYRRGRSLIESLACFERAGELDPDFAEAHAGVGQTLALLALYGFMPGRDVMTRAKAASRRAVMLAPELAVAHLAAGMCALFFDYDQRVGAYELDEAVRLEPKNIDVLCTHAVFAQLYLRGDLESAVEEAARAVALDPINGYALTVLTHTQAAAGHAADALESARRAMELTPESFYTHSAMLWALAWAGDTERALAHGSTALALFGRHSWTLAAVSSVHALRGNRARAEAVYAEALGRAGQEYMQGSALATAAAGAGRMDEVFAHCERGLDERDPFMITILRNMWPAAEPLLADPRYLALRTRVGWDPEFRLPSSNGG